MQKHIHEILVHLGENPERAGLKDTPKRVSESLKELTSGYQVSASDVIGDSLFKAPSQDLVIQQNMEFYSLCEHHLLPFFGKAHIAYIPDRHIIGLSKMGRIIDVFSQRLQVQERLTHEIAEALFNTLKPQGLAIVIEAQHFCMMMRGIKKQGSITSTQSLRGTFANDPQLRREVMSQLTARR